MILGSVSFALGVVAAGLLLIGMLGAHFAVFHPLAGFELFVLGWFVSALGLVIGFVATLVMRNRGDAPGRGGATVGLILSLVVFIPVLVLVLAGLKYPPINDITTDYQNPPEFTRAQDLPANRGRDMKYDAAKYEKPAQKAYPKLAPLRITADPSAVFSAVKSVAATMPNWRITYEDSATNTMEGVAISDLFRFRDDFVIEVRPDSSGGSVVEMRSKSRDGKGDFGVNCHRIETFLKKLKAKFPPVTG